MMNWCLIVLPTGVLQGFSYTLSMLESILHTYQSTMLMLCSWMCGLHHPLVLMVAGADLRNWLGELTLFWLNKNSFFFSEYQELSSLVERIWNCFVSTERNLILTDSKWVTRGFRLLKCQLPSTPYTRHNHNYASVALAVSFCMTLRCWNTRSLAKGSNQLWKTCIHHCSSTSLHSLVDVLYLSSSGKAHFTIHSDFNIFCALNCLSGWKDSIDCNIS